MKSQKAKKTILVIDDENQITDLLKARLSYHGYDVLTSNDPKEGIKVAASKKPNLILLDVLMPTMNGREACRLLKEDPKTKEIPVIFLTAKDSPDDVMGEMQAGASWHITKPFNDQELLDKIKEIVK